MKCLPCLELDSGGKSVLYVLGVLSMAILLQGCGGVPVSPTDLQTTTPSSGCQGPTVRPNYAVTTVRWERFPIRVYIEEVELLRRGFSSSRTATVSSLILRGLGSWATSTSGRVGSIVETDDDTNSDLNVVFRNNTGNTIHDTVQQPFIRHATVMFDPHWPEAFSDADHRWVNMAAHEMGHVLGIVAHPTGITGSLMVNEAEQLRYTAPQAVDVNSILVKYGFGCS
jgi:hypothetical protein